MVSPSDTNGRLLEGINGFALTAPRELFLTELAAPSRNSVLYMTYVSPLLDPGEGTGIFDLYEAVRIPTGWQTSRRVTPSGEETGRGVPGGSSSDHSYAFVEVQGTLGSLGDESSRSYLSRPDGTYELTGRGSLGDERFAEGRYISEGGAHVIFSTGHDPSQSYNCFGAEQCKVLPLDEKAPPEGTGAIYDRPASGLAHVVSLLPPNKTPTSGEQAFYKGTSKDASSIAFEIGNALYVRVDNGLESERTEEVAGGRPIYAGLSDEGRYLFYVAGGEDGTIHRFDTTTETDVEVNPGGEGEIVNVSSDGSHVYFVSMSALTGSEENERGEAARPPAKGAGELTAGSKTVSGLTTGEGTFIAGMEIRGEGIPPETTITEVGSGALTLSNPATQAETKEFVAGFPNLYVWNSETLKYITTVAPSDLGRTSGSLSGNCQPNFCGIPALTRWTNNAVAPPGAPGADSSRATPDGSVLIFESKAKLTTYENAGHTEIYRWNDEGEHLICVSCSPLTGAASGDARLQELRLIIPGIVLNNLSADGSTVYFETPEALVGRDTDGVNDIYQWREEGGGGAVELISSGQSTEYEPLLSTLLHAPKPNLLLSVTPTGEDVVFFSQDALVPAAGQGGTPAIYDARVGGGFPETTYPPVCLEEQCWGTNSTAPPQPQGERSERAVGGGNIKRAKHRCRRGRKGRRHKRCKRRSKKHVHTQPSSVQVSAASPPEGAQLLAPGSPEAPSSRGLPAAAGGASAPPAAAATVKAKPYGIESVEAMESSYEAGAHPDFKTQIVFNQYLNNESKPISSGHTEEISVSLPPGLLGSINATPRCDTGHLLAYANCPLQSQVGIIRGKVELFDKFSAPIYNLLPSHPKKEVARLGFYGLLYPVFIDIKVRTASDYSVTATVHSAPGLLPLLSAETTLWGSPSDPVHDPQRLLSIEEGCPGTACLAPEGKREVARTGLAFMANPSACQSGEVGFAVKSYQLPGQVFEKSAPLEPITVCTGLPFAPTFEAEPTSHVAGAPTGLKTKLLLPQHLGAEEKATATMREARVTLPVGMQVAAGAANWIGTCSEEQVGFHEEVDTACPDNSKLGTATITSPDLPEPVAGTIYQRTPQPGHQFGLWLTSDALGLHIKIPGELAPDPNTGRLTAVFSDLPQVPVEEIDLNVWGGPRAPLQNPDHCGTYTTNYSFSPHSEDPAVSGQSQMQITEGCNQGFSPTLHAGVTEPVAGRFSPLVIDLAKEDGQQQLRGFELELPDGELAKLKGVPPCPDAAAATGSCPADTAIGHVAAATGPGPEPLWVPQPGKPEPKVYLAGPYEGSPFSVVTEVPAQAGPFDLGTVVVRSGLGLDPETNRAVVKADPLPQLFEGVGLTYRRLHVVIDRPEFSLNPTDCREMSVDAIATSTQGTVAHPAARFQLEGCKRLKFKPGLSLKLKGGTERGEYPALTAVLKTRKGDANIARTSVGLPHSEFLAQEHIVTICTRKQFAAGKCPKGSIYGRAKAWTPLLAKPLEGPVYLRSSSHPLPDMVVALGGELDVNLVGRIDSHHGGIRTTFEAVPDAPVTKFVLKMRGGKKGLLVNSADICLGKHHGQVALGAQNGRTKRLRSQLSSLGCGK